MSNNTSTTSELPTSSTAAPSATDSAPTASATSAASSTSPIANNTPTIPVSSSELVSSSTSSSISLPPTSSSTTTTSSTPPPSTSIPSSTTPPTSSSTTSTTSSTSTSQTTPLSSIVTTDQGGSTITQVVTQTAPVSSTSSKSSTSSSSSSTATPAIIGSKASSGHGLNTAGTIAVAVVVPIVAVALLVLAGLFLWRKRKQRKDAEELRRKEVEEYGYNPNNDPTLPAVGGGSDGPFEMREDGSSGYRGWGTTAVASSGRKASTTLSGGHSAGGIGMAYSEGTSPSHAVSDTHSNNPLVDGRPDSEMEGMGAMGPAASGNRSDINRGPSNASSSYSAANRSDGSGEIPATGGAYYNNQYESGNPYGETQYGSPPQGRAEMSGQPVIRDVQARRNTRIENPSHFPQQSAGISQNF